MEKDKINDLNDFLNDEGTTCDINGNCVSKKIKNDKSLIERVNKTIIIEDGRQLLM